MTTRTTKPSILPGAFRRRHERVREAGTGAASTRAAGTGAASTGTGTAGTGTAGPGTAGTGSGRVVDETQNKQGQQKRKNDGPQILH